MQTGPSRTGIAVNGLEKIQFKNKQQILAMTINIKHLKYLSETSAKYARQTNFLKCKKRLLTFTNKHVSVNSTNHRSKTFFASM